MEDEMRSEVICAFVLTDPDENPGALDPDSITAATGIVPSETWRKGELINPRAILRYKHNGWRVKSDIQSDDVEEHVKALLQRLAPAWPILVELGQRYDAEFACAVFSYGGDRPPIGFGRKIVKQIAELNAGIDVDLYIF